MSTSKIANLSPAKVVEKIVTGEIRLDELEDDEVVELRRIVNPYSHGIKLEDPNRKYFAYSHINLREKYIEKFMTTAIIGYLYRCCDEWGVPEGEIVQPADEFDRDQITIDFIKENLVNGKVVLRREDRNSVSGGMEPEELATNKFKRMVIMDFLNDMFKYNPDKHVRSAYKRNKEDKSRLKVKADKPFPAYKKDETAPKEEKALQEYNRIVNRVPPVDLFYNFGRYRDNNYDALRIVTRDLYCDKPDMDHTMIIYDSFNSEEACRDFLRKHEKEMIVGISCVEGNHWTFQTNTMQNRDKYEFAGPTNILKEMLDDAQASQKLGQDMLNKRKEIKKRRNIEECGPDDENFIKQYKKETMKARKKGGIREVSSEVERSMRKIEERMLNKTDQPDPVLDTLIGKDAIEVQTWTKTGNEMNLSSFFTQAEEIDENSCAISSANG